MTRQARIAVIGTGWWATYTHIPGLLANPSAMLVAACDADSSRLAAAARAYAIERTYTDHRAMLDREQLDGVVIATPHATHFALARDCLERGLHVLVEKPLTLRAAEARELAELAQARGVELMTGYQANFTPQARRAKEAIASGELGPIQLVSTVFNSYNADLLSGRDRSDQPDAYPVHGPGAVYSQPHLSGGGHGHLQLTHALGLLFFVTGLRARRVSAWMRDHGLPLDLVDAIMVEFEGGALGTVAGTSNARQHRHDLQVSCERGGVALDMTALAALIHGPGERREEIGPEPGFAETMRFLPAANLVDVARGQTSRGTPAEVGWRTVELLDAAYRSAQDDGRPVAIAELYDQGIAG